MRESNSRHIRDRDVCQPLHQWTKFDFTFQSLSRFSCGLSRPIRLQISFLMRSLFVTRTLLLFQTIPLVITGTLFIFLTRSHRVDHRSQDRTRTCNILAVDTTRKPIRPAFSVIKYLAPFRHLTMLTKKDSNLNPELQLRSLCAFTP